MSLKAAKLDVGAKLLSLGCKSVDVPADENFFLIMTRFALLRLKNSKLTLVPMVAKIRLEVFRSEYHRGWTHTG